jgi:hypothetical protein
MGKVDIWLTSELERGEFGPLNQLHESLEAVKFDREGFIEVRHGDRTLLIPHHRVDHIEIHDR